MPELGGFLFICRTKRPDAARHMLGKRHCRVVAGRQQQPVQHALQPHMAPERQLADLRAARFDRLAGDQHR